MSHVTKDPRFPHAMLRELYEQPQALSATVDFFLRGTNLNFDHFHAAGEAMRGRNRIIITASGSSRHAGLAAEIMIEDLAGIPVDVEYASEHCYRSTHTLQEPCIIVISQSGETADSLAAMRDAGARGLPTIAITNNAESTMAREASASLPICAGHELAIPATKSFTAQLVTLYLLALYIAWLRGRMTPQSIASRCAELRNISKTLEEFLPVWEGQTRSLASFAERVNALLYLGRGIHYAIAREGALKMKESAYVQAEGYPAGELKHGPNALVNLDALLIILATRDADDPDSNLRYEKTLQLMRDMREQGARMIALATLGDEQVPQIADHVIAIPPASEHLLPVLEVVPLQMLAYFSAVLRDIDVDRPRNLVKAVMRE